MRSLISILMLILSSINTFAQVTSETITDQKKHTQQKVKPTEIKTQCNHGDSISKIYDFIENLSKKNLVNDSLLIANKELFKINENQAKIIAKKETQIDSLNRVIKALQETNKNLSIDNTKLNDNKKAFGEELNKIYSNIGSLNCNVSPLYIEYLIKTSKILENSQALKDFELFKKQLEALQSGRQLIDSKKEVEKLTLENQIKSIEAAFSYQNPNFTELNKDYKATLELLKNYSELICELNSRVKLVVVSLKDVDLITKEQLLNKTALSFREYPYFISVIEQVMISNYTSNPIKWICN